MARPIEYDPQQVVDAAMTIFWTNGYEGTSVSDLVAATKLNTCTMYKQFGGKEGLFQAVLENYQRKYFGQSIELLKSRPGLAGLRTFMDWITQSDSPNGCLFVNTITEQQSVSPGCAKYVKNYFQALEKQFEENLHQANNHGQFGGDITATAKALICFVLGLNDFSKLYPHPAEKKALINTVLPALLSEVL